MNKLWQNNESHTLNPSVTNYTASNDYKLDQKLLGYDLEASIAHVTMLESANLLTVYECNELVNALTDLKRLWNDGQFIIEDSHEDGHSAIEAHLVDKLGNIGKKIHTGRSRNDQSLVMLRLYMKESLKCISTELNAVISAFAKQANQFQAIPMPGYTHMQKAMPTTVGTWLGSFSDGFTDMEKLLMTTQEILDQNPLGSAAGFGTKIGVDKAITTKILGFAKPQDNPMYCGLSRGLFELLTIQALTPIMSLAGTFAQDFLLFSTSEFDFVSLKKGFTTGSSIMPHKHNYDLFEIMRGTAAGFASHVVKMQSIYTGIGSGYQRDLQLTKATLIGAIEETQATLQILKESVEALIVHQRKLEAAMTPELYTVDKIDLLVTDGMPFRDAYFKVKSAIADFQN